MKSIADHAKELQTRTVTVRRDLHEHPELAFEEHRTMGVIEARLRELGLDPKVGVGKTGVTALLDTGRPGPTVVARADIDALPILEENDADYRSGEAGKMHACGHDGHAAVLLSVAEILVARKNSLHGKVLFVFQPAEEIVRGAQAMLDDGALDGLDVEHVLGLHLSSGHEVGTVAVQSGPVMAAADSFGFTIKGRGGHAANPNLCVDPIVAASALVTALQALVSRETDPLDQSVISVTSFHAGSAYNIIPESVELKGTLRTFLAGTREHLKSRILEVADLTAKAFRCTAEYHWIDGSPAVVNDEDEVERLRRVAEREIGPENVRVMTPIMGGDDMALWLQQARGCYFFVGTSSGDETSFAHHHPRFDIDERGLEVAVNVFAAGVAELMQAD